MALSTISFIIHYTWCVLNRSQLLDILESANTCETRVVKGLNIRLHTVIVVIHGSYLSVKICRVTMCNTSVKK